MHVHLYVYLCVCVCVCARARARACVRACVYVCMYVWSILPKLDSICNKLSESDIIAIFEIHLDGIIVDIDLVLNDYDQPVSKVKVKHSNEYMLARLGFVVSS